MASYMAASEGRVTSGSGRAWGWDSPTLLESSILFMLSCRQRKDLILRTETLGDFPRPKRFEKPFWTAVAKVAA